MGLLSDFACKYENFASTDEGSPRTVAVSEDDVTRPYDRMSRYKLEEIYLTDPQTFNTINKSKQLIMQAGFDIIADKKSAQKKYDEFFSNIGTIGMRMDTRQLFAHIYHDKLLYGNAYVERIYNRAQTEIVDLKMVDPKLMDFARDAEDIIVVDQTQNPVGYTMDVGRRGKKYEGDPTPPGVTLKGQQIFIAAFRIAHFRMFPYGNRFEAVGIVEPAAQDIFRKHKIEDASANTIHNMAAYPIVGYVGDSTRSATQKQMKSTLEAMQNLSHSRYMVFQNPTKLETLEVKMSDQINETLKYFRGNQSSAAGMALGFSIGSGESINRSTLSTQQRMLDISLESEAKNTASEFSTLILDELNRVNNYGSKAKVYWGNVAAEEKNDKTKRLNTDVENGIIAPEEARQYVLNAENLIADDKAYEAHKRSQKAKPKQLRAKPFPSSEKESIADSAESIEK